MPGIKDFNDKITVITGAASGIGRCTAIAMGKLGCRLFLTDINGNGLKNTVDVITNAGGKVCLSRAFDVGDYQSMASFAKEIHEGYGPVEILINVAGIALFSQIEDIPHSDWEKVIKVNLWGVIHGLECFVPEMIRAGRGGHIVNVASAAGILGLPWHILYGGTKHMLVGMSESLRYDLRKHNIGVSVVCPGLVNTELVQTVVIHARTEETNKLRALAPKIAITPEKVAESIVKAIRTRKFMVITSLDIKLFYFAKKCCFPIYHLIMLAISKFMDKSLKRTV
jgi:NADP-dependent 3-hydroxy acid dehydrogenase YdfG